MSDFASWKNIYDNTYKNEPDAVGKIIQDLKDNKILGEVPVLSEVLYGLSEVVLRTGSILVDVIIKAVVVLFPYITEAIDSQLIKPLASLVDIALDGLTSAGVLSSSSSAKIKNSFANLGALGNISKLLFGINLITSYNGLVFTAASAEFTKRLSKEFRPNLAQPEIAIKSAFIAPEFIEQCYEVLRKNGYSEDDIKLMFIANYKLYDEGVIKELYLRKVLSDEQFYERMREHGYTDTRINEIKQVFEIIPPINDILTMVAKEAFEPDQINAYGLDQEFPTEQSQWLSKQGLSEYWQKKYWIAHWDYPSPQQVLEMLHRGLIDIDQVRDYYRVVEMPAYWREKLMLISYKPLTRVDVRRMHNLDVLSDQELVDAYKHEGYDTDNAVKLARFTIKYNQGSDKELTRSQIEQGYKSQIISRDDAKQTLKEIGYTEDNAEFILLYQDWKLIQEYNDEILALTKEQYKQNIIAENDVMKRLLQIGYTIDKINILIAQWDLLKIDNTKLPSKTDLDKMLTNAIISIEQYKIEMRKIGYKEQYIEWYIELIMMELQQQVAETEEL